MPQGDYIEIGDEGGGGGGGAPPDPPPADTGDGPSVAESLVRTLVDLLPTYGSNGGSPDSDPNDLGDALIDYLDGVFLAHDRASGAADGDLFRGVAADWAMGFGSFRALATFWELDNPGYGALYAIGSAFMGFLGFPAGRLAMEVLEVGAALVGDVADAIGALFGLNSGATSQMTIEDCWMLMKPTDQDIWDYFYGNDSGYNPWINPMQPPERPPWDQYANSTYLPPVVLDMNGDGVTLVAAELSQVMIDVDGDGAQDRVGWVSGGDAILVFDDNGNGRVDGVSEFSFVGYMAGARTDLEGLRAFDSNGDGQLSVEDEMFLRFKVWADDGDGVSEDGELRSLTEAGIRSIDLTGDGVAFVDQGNRVHQSLLWTGADGGRHAAWDVGFAIA